MTQTFEQYICWRNDAVLAVSPRDAVNLSDGHFQAIHHPLRLRQRKLGERAGGRWVEESDIVVALQGPLRPDGYLFLPIVGGSGTGKSHLVRWVKDQIRDTRGWEVRYLPKNRTGLRRAIEIIIRDLHGPRISEAREALSAAPAHTEGDEILGERLLDELALLVSRPEEFLPLSEGPDPRSAQMRAKLARELPDVLRDPVVRRKFLEPGAVILRLVGLALRGRQAGDGLDDDATRFRNADLPLSFEEMGATSEGARNFLRQLASVGSLLDAAIDLINEALPLAERRLTVSSQIDLVEVFREVRRALYEDSKELILFIEDLTVLHGVEREFLDAIVEPVRSASGRMCNLRMIFAVTEGHFDGLDTVRTRCDDAYWLDAVYGSGGVDPDEAASFLGRYLNASRSEPALLEASWSQQTGPAWLVNNCVGCPVQPECHETFGTSDEGYGLYPYNLAAVERLVSAVSADRFDPREVVRELVNRFLLLGSAELRQDQFPSPTLLDPFDGVTEPLNPLLSSEVRTLRPGDHERLTNVLRYWADVGDPTRVNAQVPAAFGLSGASAVLDVLRGLDPDSASRRPATGTTPREQDSRAPAGGPETRLSGPMRTHFDALRAWTGQNRDLPAGATNIVRKLVHKSVLNNLELGAAAVNLGATFEERRFRDKTHVAVRGSVTQQRLEAALIVLERTDEVAAALQGLILLSELGEAGYPQSERYRRVVAEAVEQWTSTVVRSLAGPPDDTATVAVQAMLVAATITGRCRDARSTPDYIRALFEPPLTPKDLKVRTESWRTLHGQAEVLMTRLRPIVEVEFGEARGARGDVRAVETHKLKPIVDEFITKWNLSSSDPAIAAFYRSVAPALSEEWENLRVRVAATDGLVDRGRSWSEQTDKVLKVLRTAHSAGRLDDANLLDELVGLAAVGSDQAQRSLFAAADRLLLEPELPQRLVALAGEVPGEVHAVWSFVIRASQALAGIERSLAERRASEGMTDVETVSERVLEAVDRFAGAARASA